MNQDNRTYIYDLAEISYRHGIRNVVICPGSRSAPLVLGFANHPKLKQFVIPDERSAGFIALGMAQATSQPVVLICTSGTAGLNFSPAVAEAFYQGIPLVVCTADRPPEWIGQRDSQTIDQYRLYGEHVKGFYNVITDGTNSPEWIANRMMNEAILLCKNGIPGPVHLNFPFTEPLYPAAKQKISYKNPRIIHELTEGSFVSPKTLKSFINNFDRFQRIILMAGQNQPTSGFKKHLRTLLLKKEVVCITEIISNLPNHSYHIKQADSILQAATPQLKQKLKADLIISWGSGIISKSVKNFIRNSTPAEHWHIQEFGNVPDTFKSLTHILRTAPEQFLDILLQKSKSRKELTDKRMHYVTQWLDAERTVTGIRNSNFKLDSEAAFVKKLLMRILDGNALHLANSLSVRYANLFGLNSRLKSVPVFANRGTSGIDGCTSTVVGHQLSGVRNNFFITGDVAFFYDRNAFWHKYNLKGLRIVVLNNQGGRIFGLIDGPKSRKEVSEYFIGKQPLSAIHLAKEFGFRYFRCVSGERYEKQLDAFFSDDSKPQICEFISNPAVDTSDYENYINDLKNFYGTKV